MVGIEKLNSVNTYSELNQSIEELFKQNRISNFVLDGKLQEEKYDNEKFKILFLYLETYGYEGCGVIKMKDQYKNWMRDTHITKTFRYCSLFVNTIYEMINNLEKENPIPPYSKRKLQNEYQNIEALYSMMEKCSFINFRKTSNFQSNANYDQIEKEFSQILISKQIDIINPNLIIIGGKYGCYKFNQLNLYPEKSFRFKTIEKVNDRIIAPINHFSRPRYSSLFKYAEQIANLV